jgi:hypothetical protein
VSHPLSFLYRLQALVRSGKTGKLDGAMAGCVCMCACARTSWFHAVLALIVTLKSLRFHGDRSLSAELCGDLGISDKVG